MTALLTAQGITRKYHDAPVVDDVSLTIEEGDSVVLMGPSGAGKSTVLRCLAGLEPLQGGQVLFRDRVLSATHGKPQSTTGQIGMVFQHFNLFPHLTALQNVTLAPRRSRRSRRGKPTPERHELLTGLAWRQGHAIRASFRRPAAARRDCPRARHEPGGDALRRADVCARSGAHRRSARRDEAARREGMTCVVVTHEMNFARNFASRMVFLDEGRIIEEGPTAEIFADPKCGRTKKFLEQTLVS